MDNEEPKLRRSFQQMFARTTLGMVQEGRPFTEVASTTRFKLNVPSISSLLFLDTTPRADDGQRSEKDAWVLNQISGFQYVSTTTDSGIPIEDTLNVNSPNFMRWSGTSDRNAAGFDALENAFRALFGMYRVNQASVFSDADWNTWKWVNRKGIQ